uniref:Uncharacterized protein n=1 Tax=Myotis myotis TaxID=51298 RepID=A0A7J8ALK1_MYOMY|nr:hypothetical protein mMyoMyo1_007823 [Myotis myotis]
MIKYLPDPVSPPLKFLLIIVSVSKTFSLTKLSQSKHKSTFLVILYSYLKHFVSPPSQMLIISMYPQYSPIQAIVQDVSSTRISIAAFQNHTHHLKHYLNSLLPLYFVFLHFFICYTYAFVVPSVPPLFIIPGRVLHGKIRLCTQGGGESRFRVVHMEIIQN